MFAPAVFGAPIRVACIGDSITEVRGWGIRRWKVIRPASSGCWERTTQCGIFGVSGRTLLKKGDFPYWKEPAFKQSHDFAPDVVIIKLGSNDAKPYNWKYESEFVSNYEELISSYASLPSAPRILLGTPAPVFKNGAFDINPGVVRTNVAVKVRELAAVPGRELIEFHDRMDGHGEWFPDTVHPNARGTSVMAAIAFGAVTRTRLPKRIPFWICSWRPRGRGFPWPAEAADHVLLGTTAPKASNTIWLVVDGNFVNNGTRIRTNSPGSLRLFRLWAVKPECSGRSSDLTLWRWCAYPVTGKPERAWQR